MQKQQQEYWLKAAVIGSVWASFEIIFGSFFHSLRIPFAGTFLSFFSVVLLIAFSYKWQGTSLFIKAGLIAALMRSLLPTSIILGPLIGILIEAVIFQYTINLLRRNLLSYSIVGVLVMFSAIFHKIISIIIIYGFDIVTILENLYFVLLKTTHINLPLNQLLLLVVFSYTAFGVLSAFLGMKIGKSINQSKTKPIKIDEKWEVKNTLFDIKNFKYQTFYIFIHSIALVGLLFALEFYPLQYVFIFILVYMALVLKRYAKSMRRLAKPLFWFQLIVIMFMAVLLWDDRRKGLIVGVKMIFRAIIVIASLAAISVELKNPLVKSLLYKKGYSQLYAIMGLATSAVPFILKNLAVEKKNFLNPFKVLKKSVGLSEILYQEFKEHLSHNNIIYIISGETRSGKTTYLKSIIKALRKKETNIKISGIIAHGIDKDEERFGFNIEDVATGKKKFLCSQEPDENELKIGRFYFSKEGLQFGKDALSTNLDQTDLLVIDEIGYMELKGKGWFEAIENALEYPHLNMIWVVRKRILEEVLLQWQHSHTKVISTKTSDVKMIVKNIADKLS
jgi:nucleoside-triphosphatase THEP1